MKEFLSRPYEMLSFVSFNVALSLCQSKEHEYKPKLIFRCFVKICNTNIFEKLLPKLILPWSVELSKN